MAQSKVKYSSNVLKYYIFNPNWGLQEGEEHEKIIYYWSGVGGSDAVATEQQVADCGLAEGVINFVANFDSQDSDDDLRCQAICGTKTRIILDEVEKNFWFVMTLSVPYSVLKSSQDDGHNIVEYHQDELNDRFIRLTMRNVYKHFRLISGTFDFLWNELGQNRQAFVSSCRKFFDSVIPHIKLSPINLIESYCAIQYLPLDNISFMQTQSFVNHVTCTESSRIAHSMFLYNDQLVCSSLTLNDTKVVYNYLTTAIIPDVICEEISGQQTAKTRWIKKKQKVYLHESDSKFYEMNLYRSINGSTVVLFLTPEQSSSSAGDSSNDDVLAKCEALMCTRLFGLSTKLAEVAIRINGSSNLNCEFVPNESFKFVYFNSSNRAYKSNIPALFDQRKLADSEFVRFVIDIESDLSTTISSNNVREIICKTTSDSWLIVHHSDARTLFSMLNHKNANLIEASDTVNALTAKQFKNILFID